MQEEMASYTDSMPPFFSATRAVMMIAALAVALPLHAQWLDYPTRGLPKKADGSPNLTALTPRAADGHPDLSGIWMTEQDRPCDPEGCRDLPVGEQFFNIGHFLK